MQRLSWLVSVTIVLTLVAPFPGMAAAKRTQKVCCKEISKAVLANHTLDQIMKEFDTDAASVMKCTQKRGKRRADKKSATKKAPAPARHSGTGTAGSKSPAGTSPSTRSTR